MNISSSVVTPPCSGQASQRPSPAPEAESQSLSVVHAAPMLPSAHCVGVLHGPPMVPPALIGGSGDVDFRFASAGLVKPLS